MSWSLGNLIIDLCSLRGLDPDMYDVGSLEGRVRGLLNSNNNSTIKRYQRACSEPFGFDVSNSMERCILFREVEKSFALSSMDDLIDTGEFDKRTRADSIEVPMTMNLEVL